MKLAEIVGTSSRLSETRSRLEKMTLLGEILGRAPVDEVRLVVSCLSGRLPRGRLGVGYATLQDVRRVGAASTPSLDLGEVDGILAELENVGGTGSSAARNRSALPGASLPDASSSWIVITVSPGAAPRERYASHPAFSDPGALPRAVR